MKTPVSRLLLAIGPALLLLAACGGGDDSLDDRLGVADPKTRFVHAVPAGPDLTLYRNDVAQADATGAGYKFASAYFDVETGVGNWRANTTTGNVEVGNAAIDAKRGHKYTLVALPNASSGAELLAIDDPFNKGIVSDNARVRALNASFNAQNVDVYLNAPGTDIATVAPVFPALGYKTTQPASGADSMDLEGGTYQLRITAPGTKTVIFNSPVTLDKNADWLVLTVPGAITPNAVRVLVVNADDPSRTTLELQSQP